MAKRKSKSKRAKKKETVATTGKRPGRPHGASTKKRPVVVAELARCPHCDTTDGPRVEAGPVTVRPINGLRNGQEYTHVVWRRCTCKKCGGAMRVQTFENRGR